MTLLSAHQPLDRATIGPTLSGDRGRFGALVSPTHANAPIGAFVHRPLAGEPAFLGCNRRTPADRLSPDYVEARYEAFLAW